MHDPLSRVAIKYKLSGAFVGICVIAFGVGGYLISISAGNTLEREITARLQAQAAIISGRLEHQLELLGRRAEDFASDGFIRTQIETLSADALPPAERRAADARLRMHLAENKLPIVDMVENLSVVGMDGRMVTGVYPAWYLHDADAIAGGIAADTLWGSSFLSHEGETRPVFAISTPLWDIERRQRIGTLVFWIDARNWLARSRLFESIGASFESGVAVTLAGPGGGALTVHTSEEQPIAIALAEPQRAQQSSAVFPHDAVFAFDHDIRHWDWRVHVGMDASHAMESVSALQSHFLGAGILVAIASMILLFFPVQFLIRPLARMRDAARAMMEGDYSVRVEEGTEDEIGELARSLNNMAAATQERTRKLEETALLLERRSDELKLERDLLTTVIHSMEDGLIYIDGEGKVALHNQKAEDLAAMLFRRAPEIHPYTCAGETACGQQCSACLTAMDFERPDCIVECGDAIYEVLSAKVTTGNAPSGRILVARDISDRERINERQAHQDRLAVLGEVAARMAHELNNPLAAASMFAQMMAKDEHTEFPYREHVDVIMRNIDVCKRTIQDLLNYSRNAQPELSDIDLRECVAGVVRFLRPLYEKRDIVFEMEFRLRDTVVRYDETYLRQVLMNLIMNSVQAFETSGSRVRIAASSDDEAGLVAIDISDDGPGIPADMQDRIFEPFVTSKPAGKGTGLGLSISRMIMRNFRGDLHLVSSAPGKTAFRILVPRTLDVHEKRFVEERI